MKLQVYYVARGMEALIGFGRIGERNAPGGLLRAAGEARFRCLFQKKLNAGPSSILYSQAVGAAQAFDAQQ